jgi:glycosyltransferase involved in cell wall biosynthesis
MPSRVSEKKIAILTGTSLAWNPRVIKEAMALAAAQFDVVVYGASRDIDSLEIDRALALRYGFAFKSVVPPPQNSVTNHLMFMWRRFRSRFGRDLFRVFGIPNRWQIGSVVPELLRAARKASADYYIVHLEQGAWVGVQLLRAGFRVGVDIEDWYSEDLLPEARRYRPIRLLRDLEWSLLAHGAHATCPSRAMSEALAREYKCPPPSIVYNAFQWSERQFLDGQLKDRRNQKIPSIHWFSQTLGRGRGLEDLFAALPLVEHDVEVHLRGNVVAGFEQWLSEQVSESWRARIFVHELVSNDELPSRIAEHDIGFAGEMTYCRSRDLTVTNKILQYLLAGLAVIASDTKGQLEVAEKAADAVLTYGCGNASALAIAINALLGSPEKLKRAKLAALRAANEVFCWERQEQILLGNVTRGLSATDMSSCVGKR